MKPFFTIVFLLSIQLILFSLLAQQNNLFLQIQVLDKETKQKIPLVLVKDADSICGSTDFDGMLNIHIKNPKTHLDFSHIGYKNLTKTIKVTNGVVSKIYLEPQIYALNEIIVSDKKKKLVKSWFSKLLNG